MPTSTSNASSISPTPTPNRIHNMTLDDARARVARGCPEERARHRRLVRARRARRAPRPAGALARPAVALLPRQAGAGPGPRRLRPHRRDPRLAPSARASPASSIRATRAWSRHITSSRSSSSAAPTRGRPTTRFFTPAAEHAAGGPGRDRPPLRRRARRRDRGLADAGSAGASRSASAFSGGIDSGAVFLVTYHVLLQARPATRAASRPSRCRSASGADLDQARAFLERPRPGDVPRADRGRARAPSTPSRRSASSRTTSRSTSSPRRWRSRSAAGIRERYPDWRYLARRRRRRREPQGLPDRGEPGAHDPQRPQQSSALPGGLGRRTHQALADLLGRPEPLLLPHVRAAARYGLRGLQPLHAAAPSSRSAEAIPFVDLTRYDTERLYALKGEIVSRGVEARHRDSRCRSSPSAASSTARSPESEAPAAFRSDEAGYRSHFLSLYA